MPAMQRIIKSGLFAVILTLSFTANSQANIQAPDELLKDATHTMLRSINEHREEIRKSPDKLNSLVEEIILPHLDFISASKLVMGKYWRRANKTQKLNFIRQFRLLLLRFYSSALSEYLNENNKALDENLIEYFPINIKADEKSLTVRAEVKTDKGQPIPLHYRVHLTKKGWKIYDVSVEGISMITTYKNNFAPELKAKGIDALIASLETKNKELLAKGDEKKAN